MSSIIYDKKYVAERQSIDKKYVAERQSIDKKYVARSCLVRWEGAAEGGADD